MATIQDVQNETISQANSILDDESMTLQEKLDAINQAMADNATAYNKSNPMAAPIDPMDALHCEGCQ